MREAIFLLGWWLRRRRGRGLGIGAQESYLSAHFVEGQRDNANLIAAFADEGNIIIGNMRVAEGFG